MFGGVPRTNRSAERGQSLVEFALVLPMLLVLLLGIADFGRVFAAGITMEAAARNAAEAAAQEYVQMARNRPSGQLLFPDDYQQLHRVAVETACDEATGLPNHAGGSPVCSMPIVGVCVHDASGADQPLCGTQSPVTPGCSTTDAAWLASTVGPSANGLAPLGYVEVRVCYRFTTLFGLSNLDLPFGWSISLGDVFLQRDRQFTIECYWTPAGTCG